MAEFEEVGVEAVVKGFPLFIAQLNAMSAAIAGSGVASVGAAAALAAFTLALAAIAAVVAAVVAGIALIVAGFAAITLGSIAVARSVESAFAGVAKTTNGLTDEFGKMNEAGKEVLDQFRVLAKEVPLSLEDLLRIGELAGQLGIAKDSLVGFSEVVAALAATTDLTVEKATLGLARIANIYGITADDMVANTEAIGSSLVFLGNNFATTEGEILDFAKRIAGVAKVAGITQTEILAIGAAFTSVGIEAQAGGTAVQTVIIEMTKAVAQGGDELEEFAKVSGKTVDEFAKDWETDAAGAFNDFVQGLGESGNDAFQTLEDLGIADRRIIRAFLAVGGAGDLMAGAIDGATDAFKENTALAREATIRYATFDSQMQILKNTVRDIGLEIGLLLLPALTDLFKIVTPIVEAIGKGLVPAFESIFDAIKESLLPALGELLDAFGFDITSASLTQGIANFGETIAGGIESFSDFVLDVAELVRLYKEGGIESVAAHFGITPAELVLIEDTGKAILIFAGGITALGVAFKVAGGIAALVAAITALNPLVALAVGLIGLFAVAVAFGEKAWTTLTQALQIAMAFLFLFGAVIFERVVKPAEDAFNQLLIIAIVKLTQFVDSVIAFFTNMWESIKTNTVTALENFRTSFGTGLDNVVTRIEEFVESAKQLISDMGESIVENTKIAIDNFIQSIIDWKDRTIEQIVELGVSAVQGVIDWWNNMIATLNEKGAEAGVAIGEIIVDMINIIRFSIPEWIKAGKTIMDGLLKGMKDNVGQILTFIQDLAADVINSILGAFKSGSPSRVFMDIGKGLMTGLALGIADNDALPQIALDAAATRMVAAENGIASGISSSSIDNSRTTTINANYAETQSPGSIASDQALVTMLEAAG